MVGQAPRSENTLWLTSGVEAEKRLNDTKKWKTTTHTSLSLSSTQVCSPFNKNILNGGFAQLLLPCKFNVCLIDSTIKTVDGSMMYGEACLNSLKFIKGHLNLARSVLITKQTSYQGSK